MFALHDNRPVRLCDGISRREMLRVGGLSMLGLSLPTLLHARENLLPAAPTDKTFGRAKNVIFLYMQGGPPQHETFDPKPDAPAEIRGPFKSIRTNVPGTHFCELLPRTARIADRLAVVRSMSTDDNNHDSSGYWVLTGYKYQGPNSRTIQPTDWPAFSSIIKRIKPSEVLPPLSSVWVPDIIRLNDAVTPAGQTAGFMGRQWDPDVFKGDPQDPKYRVDGLNLTDIPPMRLQKRIALLKQVDEHFAGAQRGADVRLYDQYQQQAFDLITTGKAREAFALDKEPAHVRDRYGRSTWGQSLLLARRLVEAGVRLVHVNWPRDPGDNAVDNPAWDTHAQNADRLEDVLCPQFDFSFPVLIEDLRERGLLEETLVVLIGEFGRTPKINPAGGRDHWGHVFSFALAGAGVAAGQVYGASDKDGAYPAQDRVEPGDLTATICHLLGIDPKATFTDPEGREHRVTQGTPLFKLLGTEPATDPRRLIESDGDLNRVPFDPSLLLNTDFATPGPLRPPDLGSRPKGWRGFPLADEKTADALCVKLTEPDAAAGTGRRATIGFGLADGASAVNLPEGATALLAQEIRNPRSGKFVLTARAAGGGSSREFFETVFLKHFTCRLVIYRYNDQTKDPRARTDLASAPFQPAFAEPSAAGKAFTLDASLLSPSPGVNFSIGNGLGVAVVVQKTTPGGLDLPADGTPHTAYVRLDGVRLDFAGATINEDVTV